MKILKSIFFVLLDFLDYLIPKVRLKYVFTSFPDFSDNAFALYLHVLKNHPEIKNIWLIDDLSKTDLHLKTLQNYIDNPPAVRFVKKNSLKGFYHFLTARYVFFTHGIYKGMRFSPRHIVVNLWHGMPLKKIGYLDPKSPVRPIRSKYITVTSGIYQKIFEKAFRMPASHILISGQVRNDLLFDYPVDALQKLGINPHNEIIIWMPTYRKSIVGDIRTDGLTDKKLPLFELHELAELNRKLKILKKILIVKLHPMDYLNLVEFPDFSHIRFLKNEDFEAKGIQLYSLLAQTDVLLTDYSSVYIDYMLTGKPIGFVMEDWQSFKEKRGFVFDNPEEYMPGKIIDNPKDFIDFIQNPVKHPDYEQINSQLNEVRRNFAVETLQNLKQH